MALRLNECAILNRAVYITITAPSPALDKLVAAGRARAQARSAERARLASLPVALIDFGPPGQPLGMLKGYGLPHLHPGEQGHPLG